MELVLGIIVIITIYILGIKGFLWVNKKFSNYIYKKTGQGDDLYDKILHFKLLMSFTVVMGGILLLYIYSYLNTH